VTRLVAGGRAGDDPTVRDALAGAAQVAVRLQLAQGRGDAGRALREAGGKGLDVDAGACRGDWMCTDSPIASRDSSGCWARWLPITVKRVV
jgi:hypothetical protein